jgi:hypothetical protein
MMNQGVRFSTDHGGGKRWTFTTEKPLPVSAKIICDYQRPRIIIRLCSFLCLFQCSLPLLSGVVLCLGLRKHGVGNLEVTMRWAVIACRVAGSWELLC